MSTRDRPRARGAASARLARGSWLASAAAAAPERVRQMRRMSRAEDAEAAARSPRPRQRVGRAHSSRGGKFDQPALVEILGSEGKTLVVSQGHGEDRSAPRRSRRVPREQHTDRTGFLGTTATLSVGKSDWPLPIPIVKEDSTWRFDAEAGARRGPPPSHRRERARRHPGVPRLRRGSARIRPDAARWGAGEPVRPAHHQHARKAGWSGVASRGRQLAGARRGKDRRSDRRGLQRSHRSHTTATTSRS